MPEPSDFGSPPGESSHELLLRSLYDEQQRLRNEVERLRSTQQQLQDQVKESQQKKDKAEEDQDKGEGKDKNKNDGKDQKDNKEGEEKKESKTKKVEGWARLHPVWTLAIVIGTVCILIAGYFVWQYLESYESTDDAQVDGHTDPISARINGFVVGAYVENTYEVKKGQVLVDLDPRDYLVSLEQSRASLAQAQASLRAQNPNVPITTTTQSTAVTTAALTVDSAVASVASAEQSYRSGAGGP